MCGTPRCGSATAKLKAVPGQVQRSPTVFEFAKSWLPISVVRPDDLLR